MKKRKRPPILLLLTALALMLTACGAPSASLPTVNPDKTVQNTKAPASLAPQNSTALNATATQTAEHSAAPAASETIPPLPSTVEPTETQKPSAAPTTTRPMQTTADPLPTSSPTNKPSPSKERFMDELCACYESVNGYSLQEKNSSFYIVDSQGYATCAVPNDEEILTPIHNGVFLTQKGDSMILRSVNGSVVFSNDNLNGAKLCYENRFSSDLFFGGYIMLYRAKQDNNGPIYEIGFIDTSGKWVAPLSAQSPLLSAGYELLPYWLDYKLYYCGEGTIAFLSDADSGFSYYNFLTKKTNPIEKITCDEILFEDCLICNYVNFHEGLAVHSSDHYYYIFYADGKTQTILKKLNPAISEKFGRFVYNSDTGRFTEMGIQNDVPALYLYDHSAGKIIKKIENLHFTEINGFHIHENNDVTAQISIKNKDGYYYAVIDDNGNYLFNPIKTETDFIFNPDGEWVKTSETNSYNEGSVSVINNKGKLLLKTDRVRNFSIQNGVVRYEKDGKTVYTALKQ